MKTVLLLALAIGAATAGVAAADPLGVPCPELSPANQWLPSYQARGEDSPPVASTKGRALLALRREGLLLKKQDGGLLSDAHRASLQARLDAIQGGRY